MREQPNAKPHFTRMGAIPQAMERIFITTRAPSARRRGGHITVVPSVVGGEGIMNTEQHKELNFGRCMKLPNLVPTNIGIPVPLLIEDPRVT